MSDTFVVVGGDAAGTSAASKAKREDPDPDVALGEVIDVFDEVGTGQVAERIHGLAGLLTDGVPDDGFHSPATPETGLVTVDVEDPGATVERLASEAILVRALPAPKAIRASVHAVNTRAEVDRLLEALEPEWS